MAAVELTITDPEQYSIKNSNIYYDTVTIDVSAEDQTFEKLRGLHITVAGDVKFAMKGDKDEARPRTLTVSAIPATGFLDWDGKWITKIYNTGTTATIGWGWL